MDEVFGLDEIENGWKKNLKDKFENIFLKSKDTKEELRQKAESEADKVIIGSGMDRASVTHLKHLLVTMYMQGATEATKEFESCLEDTIKGKNPFPNICWKLICDANDKFKKQNKQAKEIIREILTEDDYSQSMYKELRIKAEAFLKE